MQDQRNRQRGIGATVIVLLISGLVSACTNGAMGPGSQATDSPVSPKDKGSLATSAPVAQPPAKADYIVVEHGQSLNRIAHAHRVTPAALAAANHLQPPYKLKAGSKLILPDRGSPPIQQANTSSAPPSVAALPPPTLPSPPSKSVNTAVVGPLPVPPSAAPLDGPPKDNVAPPPQLQAQAASVSAQAPPVLPPRNPAAALPLPGEPAMWPSSGPIVNKTGEGPTN